MMFSISQMADKFSDFIRQCVNLEAKYKFSTDIFTRGTLTKRFSFSLRQVICAVFQFILMDVQRTCIWRTVNSRHTTCRSFGKSRESLTHMPER